jgi:hypothetical protein
MKILLISVMILKINPMAPNVIYCICNMQYDAQNAKYHINISATLQSPFTFLLCADHYGNNILVPKG